MSVHQIGLRTATVKFASRDATVSPRLTSQTRPVISRLHDVLPLIDLVLCACCAGYIRAFAGAQIEMRFP